MRVDPLDVALAAPELDRAYVRTELIAMMGADDERIARWDTLART